MSHFCNFCQLEHSSNSCYHPGSAKILTLQSALKKYGSHNADCHVNKFGVFRDICDCGFDEAMRGL